MAKPLIGITTYNAKNPYGRDIAAVQHTYIQAVTQAGGVPVLIPAILPTDDLNELYARLQGILFSGGGDISLKYFDGENHPKIDLVDENRDVTELSLLRQSVENEKPFLAICRGMQIMNVALGGTLHTHIPDQIQNSLKHDNEEFKHIAHPVNIDEDSKMAEIFGETLLQVNSLHHQAIKDLASNLRIVGHAPDGVIEAVELPDHPYAIGVQWHPEWLTDQSVMRRLFKSFVDASGNNS
ncbi:MAG: gamma-glutamyl-gamma-aminobutyrate hydrolase family protein [Anaerolineales bacterium]|nr:gamma-glutamyl-gamma-aminobutyrate hydrolase family protein [Anaerolineales bacterium]MBX3037752.1 gamma-glutamyl-gamma-aminobutyrate hydrolase family protein [Anaerolineales bacterium]